MKRIFLLYLILQLNSYLSKAQTDTTFWFAAPFVSSDYNYDRPIILRISSYQQPCTVTISQPANGGMVTQTITLPANTTQSVDLTTWINNIECSPGNVIQNNGIKVASNNNISVYYDVNEGGDNPELYSLKGRNALGNQFYISSQYLLDNNSTYNYNPEPYSSFNIVATEDNTQVTITPTKNIIGHNANIPFTITLNKGQTYAAIAASQSASQHLEGSYVTSNNPIAITLSDDLLFGAGYNGGCADLAGDQTVPVNVVGTEYIAIQTNLNPPYDQVYITATQNATTVTQDGALVTTLNAGQSVQLAINNKSTYIQTSAPAYAYQLAGVGCEVGSAILPKITCTGSTSVSIARNSSETFTALLLVKNGAQNSFLVNNVSGVITAAQFSVVPNTGGLWYEAKVSLPLGNYPVGTVIKISNNTDIFQMGNLQGGVLSGASFGYFSDFNTFEAHATTANSIPCVGSVIQLFADTIASATYSWTGPNNFTSNLQNPVINNISLANSGKYILDVTIPSCGSYYDTVNINVYNCTIPCNNWLHLQGGSDAVTLGDLTVTGNQLTVEASFNTTSYSRFLVSKHSFPGDVNYSLLPDGAEINAGGVYHGIFTTCNWINGKTYHVASVYDGTTFKFYRDGFLIAQQPASGPLTTNGLMTHLGFLASEALPEQLIGYLNEVRIWNVARPQDSIRAYMNSSLPNPTTQPGLLGYYTFDNLLNKQGNTAYNGTLQGNTSSINATNPNCTFVADSCCTPTSSIIDTTICQGLNYLGHSSTGTYFDTLTNATGCDSIITINLTVTSVSVNAGNDSLVCKNIPFTLHGSGTNIIRYAWTPKSVLNDSTLQNPIATISTNTKFYLTVTGTFGCTRKDSVTISVQNITVQTNNDTTICFGKSIQLNTSGASTYSWAPANYLSNSTIANPVATPLNTIQYIVTGTSSIGCTANDTVNIIVIALPIVKTNNDTAICIGNSVQLNTIGAFSYSWAPSIGLSNAGIDNPIATPTSTTQYIVTGTNGNGCVASDTVNITINPIPIVSITNDTSICKNSSIQLFASGGINYQWSPAATINNPASSSPVVSPTATTIYYVIVTDANNCSNNDSIKVSMRALPDFTVSPNQLVCTTTPIQLSAAGGDVYQWSPPTSVNNSTISNPLTNINTSTTFTVLIKESTCNNSTTLTTTITLLPPLTITTSKSNDLDCSNGSAKLIAYGANKYSWSPGNSLDNSLSATPVASPLTTQQYIVEGSTLDGCKGYDTITVYVNYADGKSGYYMPNAFTPNGDGINDCYGIKYWGLIEKLEFTIYDRFGNNIFYTTNPSACWDGSYKGQPANAGNYVYFIKAVTACGNVERKGNLLLIR